VVKVKVPTAEYVAKKYIDVTPARAKYYEMETPKAADYWFDNTIAAAETYKAAVMAVDIDKRFSGGVRRVGAAKFKRKVEAVGVARYGPGVRAAEEDMKKGIAPYLEEIAKTDIPARKPRGDPENWERSRILGEALHKKGLELLAALVASS